MADTTAARQALAKKDKAAAPTIYGLIEKQQGQVAKAIGSEIGATRFVRNMMTTLRTNPRLAQCTPESLLGAMMQSAQLRLDPGPLQLVHFVPYQRQGRYEAQFQIGYRGYSELAFRAGIIITAHEVCEQDQFSVEWGSQEIVTHKPSLTGNRGEVIGYYAVARRDGVTVGSKYLSVEQAQAHRKQYSKSRTESPWDTAFDEMALKTCVRLLAKRLPLSVVGEEVADAVALDTSVLNQDDEGVIEVQAVECDDDGVVAEPTNETLL